MSIDVFLFPLVNVTLFPRTTKPLHIFEARYIQMVQQAVETGTPVALGFIPDPSTVGNAEVGQNVDFVNEVAGYGKVQVIEERPNGTMLVFIQGFGRCRLGRVKKNQPYIVCEAETIPEDNNVSAAMQPKLEMLKKILLRWVSEHIPEVDQRELFLRKLDGPEEVIGCFASYLVRDNDLQQFVLEFPSVNEQIEYLHRLASSGEITG